ncbi:hypothetical protein GC176_28125 [bacterium]|nr:hypothetical protein [bacterium]
MRQIIVALMLAAVCLNRSLPLAMAQNATQPVVSGAAEAAANNERATPSDAKKKSELRRQSALAGLLVLALLCFVFLTLMICVVLWARRIRRFTNQPLPRQHPGDPLWYLRKSPEESPVDDEPS